MIFENVYVQLKKRPTFFIETNPQAGKHTQWKQLDHDFTGDHASNYRFPALTWIIFCLLFSNVESESKPYNYYITGDIHFIFLPEFCKRTWRSL